MTNWRYRIKAFLFREDAISAVEYAMIIALVGAGIIMAAGHLGGAVSNEMTEAAEWFDESCGNDGGGDGTGGEGGPGQGGENTC
jgi:Flp pilus assembly pilin Flp